MKVNTRLNYEAEYIGDIQENRVGIDKNNVDFITTLLTSNLYSKPFKSFLRETVANAYDSHLEAGTDEPILLLIQDSNGWSNYTISIRDYGVGISPERFENIYKNIGSSTKRDSNDYIGMFGIGRFSCLSCADIANITSYYNGKKYSYLMYKNGSGINIDKVSEIEGDFKNGLEVSIKKYLYSHNDWEEALIYLCLFDKLHIEYQGETSYISDLVSRFNNREVVNFHNFSYCSLLPNHRSYFKVGNVLYDIENSIDLKTTSGLIIDLPIGSVDITPNRESLQYTEYTNTTINTKVAETKKELQDIINTSINGDISMCKFFSQYCDSYKYEVNINSKILNIDKRDVKADYSSTTIGGEPVPEGYDEFLNEIKNYGIPRALTYKTVNESESSRWSINTSIRNLILGKYTLGCKQDKVTKHVTWSYFIDNLNQPSVVLKYDSLELLKEYMDKWAKGCSFISEGTIDKYIDFFFKNIKIDIISNEDVPSNYIKEYKLEQKNKRKKVDAAKIPVRQYYTECYRKTSLEEIPKKGLIIYTSHTQDDFLLKELARLVYYYDGVGCVITLKPEYFPLIADNKRFISVDSFLSSKNKLLTKLATAKIILDKFEKAFGEWDLRSTFPIWAEFVSKYAEARKALTRNINNKVVKNITDYYIQEGWVNQCDIQYFSLSEEEIQVTKVWKVMREHKTSIIQMLVFQKFGRIPKIGLKPVKIPKLTYIKEKINESI